MYVLGVDPGVKNIGVSIVDFITYSGFKEGTRKLVMSTTFNPENKDLNVLVEISDYFQSLIIRNPICVLAYEEPTQNNKFPTDRFMYYGVGVLLEMMKSNHIEVYGYAPTTIKKIVAGKGNASKKEVKEKIKLMYPLKDATSHSVDSLACIETYLSTYFTN
jgi:Holliday junction resolvasome RuvABC endonuclease subunit